MCVFCAFQIPYREVQGDLKKLVESPINQKNNYAYEKAVECALILKDVTSLEEWNEFIEDLYKRHFRKINLWKEFRKKGIEVKK